MLTRNVPLEYDGDVKTTPGSTVKTPLAATLLVYPVANAFARRVSELLTVIGDVYVGEPVVGKEPSSV